MRMRPGKPCSHCCPAASWAVQQVGGSEEGGQAAGRRGGVGVGVWAVLPQDLLQANTTPKGCPPGSLLSSPLCLGSAHLPAGWSRQQYLALLHLYVFEALLPERRDAAGEEHGGMLLGWCQINTSDTECDCCTCPAKILVLFARHVT